MCIDRKKRKIEGLIALAQLCQFFFREIKKIKILKSPPYPAVRRNLSYLGKIIVIFNIIIAVLSKVQLSSSEIRI